MKKQISHRRIKLSLLPENELEKRKYKTQFYKFLQVILNMLYFLKLHQFRFCVGSRWPALYLRSPLHLVGICQPQFKVCSNELMHSSGHEDLDQQYTMCSLGCFRAFIRGSINANQNQEISDNGIIDDLLIEEVPTSFQTSQDVFHTTSISKY